MISKNFAIHELVPPHIFDKYGEKAWRFIQRDIVIFIDLLKERFPRGKITINNYYWGGAFKWSGLRTQLSPYYSEASQHAFGGAVDAKFSEYNVDDVREDIINNPEIYYMIKGIELEVEWLHADTRNEDTLKTFKP